MSEQQNPSVGRIVHYVSYGTPGGEYTSQCRAAIITEVAGVKNAHQQPDDVGLAVLNPTGMFFNQNCRHSEGPRTGGTWHWPERT